MRSQCLRNKNLICEKVESCFPKTYLFNLLVLFRDSFLAKKFGSPFIRFAAIPLMLQRREANFEEIFDKTLKII